MATCDLLSDAPFFCARCLPLLADADACAVGAVSRAQRLAPREMRRRRVASLVRRGLGRGHERGPCAVHDCARYRTTIVAFSDAAETTLHCRTMAYCALHHAQFGRYRPFAL